MHYGKKKPVSGKSSKGNKKGTKGINMVSGKYCSK